MPYIPEYLLRAEADYDRIVRDPDASPEQIRAAEDELREARADAALDEQIRQQR